MPITSQPVNPFNNITPNMLTENTFADPFEIAALMATKAGLPTEILDTVYSHCNEMVKDSWLGFIDMFNMNIPFTTDYVNFLETTSPDYVLDADGAVARTGNVFTINFTVEEGYVAGEDAWFFRPNDVITVTDGTKQEVGVIITIDKAAGTFTAVSRNGLNWTVGATNLSLDVTGGDWDKASCGPEGLLELRKKISRVLKLEIIKDAIQATGGTRYAYCVGGTSQSPEVKWYDDNTLMMRKRLNTKVAKTLMLDIESVDGSGAYLAGKYGTMGLFQNVTQNGLVHTGYIITVADLEAVTSYWDSLGFSNDKEFIFHVDNTQYRHFEKLAVLAVKDFGINVDLELCCAGYDLSKVGFNMIYKDGYKIFFSRWGLTDGNSPLGKNRIAERMPKGFAYPMGTVRTSVNGQEMNLPYVFKAYQNMSMKPGMVRTYLTGGFNGDGDCEYAKTSLSTTVGIATPCAEALVIIV